jgi:hypothetical protein
MFSFLGKPACRINPLMALHPKERGSTSGLPENQESAKPVWIVVRLKTVRLMRH